MPASVAKLESFLCVFTNWENEIIFAYAYIFYSWTTSFMCTKINILWITSLEVKRYSTTLLWSEKICLLLNPSGAGAQDFKESFPTSPVKSTSNHQTKTLYWTHDGVQQVDWHVVRLWKPKLFFFFFRICPKDVSQFYYNNNKMLLLTGPLSAYVGWKDWCPSPIWGTAKVFLITLTAAATCGTWHCFGFCWVS